MKSNFFGLIRRQMEITSFESLTAPELFERLVVIKYYSAALNRAPAPQQNVVWFTRKKATLESARREARSSRMVASRKLKDNALFARSGVSNKLVPKTSLPGSEGGINGPGYATACSGV
jgi:hypothetical protein